MRNLRAGRPPALPIAALLIALAAGLPPRPAGCAVAGDARAAGAVMTARDAGDVGKGFKDLGRKIGAAGKQVGLEVADAAKRVWYKGKQVSKPKLDQVQEKTREFWSHVIEGKDRTLEELRRENDELKHRAAERKDAD